MCSVKYIAILISFYNYENAPTSFACKEVIGKIIVNVVPL
jgi:hypothetical protein